MKWLCNLRAQAWWLMASWADPASTQPAGPAKGSSSFARHFGGHSWSTVASFGPFIWICLPLKRKALRNLISIFCYLKGHHREDQAISLSEQHSKRMRSNAQTLYHWKLQLDKLEEKTKKPFWSRSSFKQVFREVMGSPFLEIFVIQLPKAMGSLI